MDKQNMQKTNNSASQTQEVNVNHHQEQNHENDIKNASSFSNKKYLLLFILLLLLLAGAVFIKIFNPLQKKPTSVKKTVMREILIKRSKDTGQINRGLTGKVVDVNTGKIIKAARIFSSTDSSVYLELDLNSVKRGLAIDYVRYHKGRYVDHGEITIPKDNTENVLFSWQIKRLFAQVHDGDWTVATYADGILAKRIMYQVVSGNVSYVYPEQKILTTDKYYKLGNALAQK